MPFVHGKGTSVLVDQYDLSPYFTQANTSQAISDHDTTTFGNNDETHITGTRSGTASCSGLFDGAANAVDAILTAALGAATTKKVSICPQGAGTLGNRAKLMAANEVSYDSESTVGDLVTCSAELKADGGLFGGVVLAALAAVTATGNGTSVDNAAATTGGAIANLHITAVSGTTPSDTIKIQHSTDNSTWVDLITFTAATAVGTQQGTVTGTVNRYTRVVDTITGTTPSFTRCATFARKP